MALIRPFRGLRPRPEVVAQVAAPPYDVLSSAEARQLVAGNPLSFLHLSKPEIDLPEGTPAEAPEVYARGRSNLEALLKSGVLQLDPVPCYYAYRLTSPVHSLTGLVAAASVAAYERGDIRRHEFTRAAKEDDRTRMIEALGAQTGPVMLAWRATAALRSQLEAACQTVPDLDCVAVDGVRHQLWVIRAPEDVAAISQAAAAVPRLYIADGHHRAASAARVAQAHRARSGGDNSNDPAEQFLAVLFAHDDMQVLDYNRLVSDLHGMRREELLARLAELGALEAEPQAVHPRASGSFGVYLPGQWYRLTLPGGTIPVHDPIARLDVSLLADRILGPLLGIQDPRTDARIDFVGGARGLAELEARVDSGEMAVAFALFPTRVEDVMAVSDQGDVMPPKSTWFEPKLADGMVSHLLANAPQP